ncbi:MAG: hypothetical protein AAFV72_00760 [Cyanobacteria bacterium J06635_1]
MVQGLFLLGLGLSIWPGYLDELAFWGVIFLFVNPIIRWSVLGIVLIVIGLIIRQAMRKRGVRRRAIATLAWILIASGFITGKIPLRIAFQLSKPAFTAAISQPPTDESFPQQLGIYRVLDIERFPVGDVYFRTTKGGFLAPTYYGFAYQPDATSNPYGEGFQANPLTSDWYLYIYNVSWEF